MTSIDNFLSEVYSEESFAFSEEEYAEVMSAEIETAPEFAGYEDWSNEIEQSFEVEDNKLCLNGKPFTTPKRGHSIGGIEI